ncbi:hypothetical protein N7453_010818 [Penicillium expansum]|nr:hypothetical protein N7453_010818 [Penicillium expansum]
MADTICPDSPIPESWDLWMASSEVDQKALGNFAAVMGLENPLLSATLYKVLGVSLLRARKLRRLDTTRETRSLQLYHHIIWLSREGLLILEGYILPMVDRFVELKVLAYKLRASFYHIFVLFHNRPIFTPDSDMPTRLKHDSIYGADALTALGVSDTYNSKMNNASTPTSPPRPTVQLPQPLSSFLLPPLDYTATATACFNHASSLSDKLLPGSHPLRLSVKLEYAAYLYDCLQDPIACRRLAKQAIADVYNAQEGMDDESFKDAADRQRVGQDGQTWSTGTPGSSVSRGGGSHSRSSRSASHLDISVPTTVSPVPVTKSTPVEGARVGVSRPAVPDASMMNPI